MRRQAQTDREIREREVLEDAISKESRAGQRRLERACETGAWLTTTPNHLNGTVLSADEFRDSLRLRYGLVPTNLPTQCDGCGERFGVQHALSCKKGGLVVARHNEVAGEWHTLCARALTAAAASDEPLIHTSQPATPATRAPGTQATVDPETRGDVAVRGFWKRGTTAIFDIRVTDTEVGRQRGQDPAKVLARHEKEKKDKYLEPCLARRRQFTPLVFSVDGMRGAEATAASKRLASLLSKRWNRPYSQVCGFVRSRLSMALVRATSLCLRGSRDPVERAPTFQWESGTGLMLY